MMATKFFFFFFGGGGRGGGGGGIYHFPALKYVQKKRLTYT